MGLAERIKEAMGEKSPAVIARATGKTPGAVSQWLDGKTKSLKADTASVLEAVTGYRAGWIATGKGPKKVAEDARAPVNQELSDLALHLAQTFDSLPDDGLARPIAFSRATDAILKVKREHDARTNPAPSPVPDPEKQRG